MNRIGRRTVICMAVILLFAVLMSGCAASKQEVASRLGDQFLGQNVDSLVMKLGPPASMYRMNSGGSSYVWQLDSITDVNTDRGFGTVSTRYCKISAVTSAAGTVIDLQTQDSNGTGLVGALAVYGSICARYLGMKPAAT